MMTIIDLEGIVNKLYDADLSDFSISDLDVLVEEVKQYGLDLQITQELLDAYQGDYLDKYCESKI